MQEAPQRLAIVVLSLLGHAGIRCPIEAMIRPRIHVKLDRHPGAASPQHRLHEVNAVLDRLQREPDRQSARDALSTG